MNSDIIKNPCRLIPAKAAFARMCVGNTKGWELIARGAIKAVKLDGKTLVDEASVDSYLASLPPVRVRA